MRSAGLDIVGPVACCILRQRASRVAEPDAVSHHPAASSSAPPAAPPASSPATKPPTVAPASSSSAPPAAPKPGPPSSPAPPAAQKPERQKGGGGGDPSGSASGGGSAFDIAALLRIGPVVEHKERAAKARAENSRKGEWARHAHEVLEILAAGGYEAPSGGWVDVREAMQRAVAGSVHYPAKGWRAGNLPAPRFASCESFEVWNCTVLSATQELALGAADGDPPLGALNFASARNPGGGFSTGAAAQEESIARSSGLYPCLTRYFDEFFVPNRKAESGVYTHDMIFSPQVPVVRDDGGALLDRPYAVDFVTAAAPNVGVLRRAMGEQKAQGRAKDELRERVPRVLDLFARHGARDLVLGAWGCGVFGNEPRAVAALFQWELQRRFSGCFRRVVFAVLDASMASDFADVFKTDVVPPASATSQWGAKQKWSAGRGKKGSAAPRG